MALDHFVPHEGFDSVTGEAPHKDLFRVGFVSTLAIGLHNFPEGVATFMAGYEDAALGVSIAIAIAMHNIPEGISVAMPIWYATGSRRRAFQYTLLSGMAEPGRGPAGLFGAAAFHQWAGAGGALRAGGGHHGLYHSGGADPLLPAVRA